LLWKSDKDTTMKKYFILIFMLVPLVLACPSDAQFKHEVKKGLFNYISNPEKSILTFNELQDIMTFYLTESNVSAINCNQVIRTSGVALSSILSKTDNIGDNTIPICSDGTLYGSCSNNRPAFCYSGMLKPMCYGPDHIIGNSDDCSCPNTFLRCVSDGTCSSSEISCFSDNDCGANGFSPAYCNGSTLYHDHITFDCALAGTSDAHCTYDNVSEKIEDCSICSHDACV
jgi:hypothetical protein